MDFTANVLPAKTINGIVYLDFSKIIRLEADCKHSLLFIKDQDKHIRSILPFGTMEEMLPQRFFFKCHRSHIFNLLHLKEFNKPNRKIYLSDNHVVSISEDRISEFIKLTDKFGNKG